MHAMLANLTISMSEFKKNPAAILRQAGNRPVAVLSHNKPAFYVVEPTLFAAMLEDLGDRELHGKVLTRLDERARAIEADIDRI